MLESVWKTRIANSAARELDKSGPNSGLGWSSIKWLFLLVSPIKLLNSDTKKSPFIKHNVNKVVDEVVTQSVSVQVRVPVRTVLSSIPETRLAKYGSVVFTTD